jgi:uncharacterized protein
MIIGTYINMPVKSVSATRTYFTGLGFSVNEQFSNDLAISIALGPSF